MYASGGVVLALRITTMVIRMINRCCWWCCNQIATIPHHETMKSINYHDTIVVPHETIPIIKETLFDRKAYVYGCIRVI